MTNIFILLVFLGVPSEGNLISKSIAFKTEAECILFAKYTLSVLGEDKGLKIVCMPKEVKERGFRI